MSEVMIPDPKADPHDIRNAIDLKLEHLRSIAYVGQCEDFHKWAEEVTTPYMASIVDYANEIGMLLEAAWERMEVREGNAVRAAALMRDLYERIYAVDEYLRPEPKKKGTKENALKGVDGIYDVMDAIKKALGIGDVLLFKEVEDELVNVVRRAMNK